MKVKIKLFATLREGRFAEKDFLFDMPTKVIDVVRMLEIPEAEIALIFINGTHSSFDYPLRENDTLALFPPIGGG